MDYSFGDVKRFLMNKINIIIMLSVCILISQLIIISNQINNTKTVTKKIDHRYFNATNSLEDIHHVNINTLDGSVRR